jgi:hypothetical protein
MPKPPVNNIAAAVGEAENPVEKANEEKKDANEEKKVEDD